MKTFTKIALMAALMAASASFAVEPAYQGPLGNNEEPATRPYKWLYQGVKSLFWHTGDQFVEGNLHAPVVGRVQGFRGLRRGSVSLGESTYRGLVFAPVPPRNHYKRLGAANTAIEDDMFTRNSSDFLFSWYFFPVMKAVDNNPIEGDTKVGIRQKEAKDIRVARNDATRARKQADVKESDMKSAQRDYIGARADYGTPKTKMGRGNLMKLGR